MRWARVDADSIIRDCTANNVIYRVFATEAWSRTCIVYLFIRFLDVIWLALFSVWFAVFLAYPFNHVSSVVFRIACIDSRENSGREIANVKTCTHRSR